MPHQGTRCWIATSESLPCKGESPLPHSYKIYPSTQNTSFPPIGWPVLPGIGLAWRGYDGGSRNHQREEEHLGPTRNPTNPQRRSFCLRKRGAFPLCGVWHTCGSTYPHPPKKPRVTPHTDAGGILHSAPGALFYAHVERHAGAKAQSEVC